MIRVLLVDDSKTHRMALKSLLEKAKDFEVIGLAENGEEGVERTILLKPDIVLMDVNMPVLDGLAATARIMAEKPTPILLMTASENLRSEVDLGLRALEIGALDLLSKPEAIHVQDRGAQALLTRLKLLAGVPVISHPRGLSKRAKRLDTKRGSSIIHRARRVIAVAASTGGPRALKTFLGGLPADLDASIVIVQHIDVAFLEGLVKWLGEDRPFPVSIGEDGRGLHEGEAILAPGLVHMEIGADRRVILVEGTQEGGHRPSGDRLLRSVARAVGPRAIGVVLTGMGEDGARGLLAIKEAGGVTFAQDEASSVIYGMPRAAVALGAAQSIVPLGKMAEAVAAAARALP